MARTYTYEPEKIIELGKDRIYLHHSQTTVTLSASPSIENI